MATSHGKHRESEMRERCHCYTASVKVPIVAIVLELEKLESSPLPRLQIPIVPACHSFCAACYRSRIFSVLACIVRMGVDVDSRCKIISSSARTAPAGNARC